MPKPLDAYDLAAQELYPGGEAPPQVSTRTASPRPVEGPDAYDLAAEELFPAKPEAEQARAVAYATRFDNPDEAALVGRLARESGLPVEIVKRNLAEVQGVKRAEEIDFDRLVKTSPWTAGLLQNPDTAPAVRDDVANLEALEHFFDNLPKGTLGISSRERVPVAPDLPAGEALRKAPAAMAETGKIFGKWTGRRLVSSFLGLGASAAHGIDWLTESETARGAAEALDETVKQIKSADVESAGGGEVLNQLFEGAGSTAAFFVPGWLVARGMGLAAKSIPALAKATEWAGASAMGIAEAFTEAGSAFDEAMQKSGGDRWKAETVAAWTFWGNLPLTIGLDKLGFFNAEAAGSAAGQALTRSAAEGAQEFGQELVPQVAMKAEGLQESIDWQQAFLAGAIGAVAALPFSAPHLARAGLSQEERVAQEIMETVQARRAEAAPAESPLAPLGDLASASKTRERDPALVRDWVDGQLKDTGAETVYADTEAVTRFLQEAGTTPEEVGKVLPGFEEAYQTAVDRGSDVELSLADWTAHVLGTPLGEALKGDVKIDPLDLTDNERADPERKRVVEERLKADFDAAEKALREAREPGPADRVREDFVQKLLATGRYSKTDAETNATILAAHYQTLSQYFPAKTAWDLYAETNLAVQNQQGTPDPDGVTYNQSGQIEKNEAFWRWAGGENTRVVEENPGNVEFQTGEPVVVKGFHGTRQSFDAFSLEKAGAATGAPSARKGIFLANRARTAESYTNMVLPEEREAHDALFDEATRLHKSWYLSHSQDPKRKAAALAKYDRANGLFKQAHAMRTAGANVMPLYVAFKNPMVYDMKGKTYREASYSDLIDQAKAAGHDGLIIKRTYDQVLGDALQDDVYIAFEPTQVKSVFNRGTWDPKDPRILYQGPRLQALHNLSSENLLFAAKMGGLAVPSIGVLPEGQVIQGYGDITLIGTEEIGDPAKVPVYDADAYTSTFPRAEYPKAKTGPTQKLVDRFRDVVTKYDSSRTALDSLWDSAVNRPDPEQAFRALLESNGAKAMFLAEHGEKIEPAMKEPSLEAPFVRTKAFRRFLEAHGGWDANFGWGSEYMNALGPAVKDAIAEYVKEQVSDDPELAALLKEGLEKEFLDAKDGSFLFGRGIRLDRSTQKMDINEELDSYKTRELLDEALKGRETHFRSWVEAQVMPLFKDPFLRIGGKKQPYTLGNIVAAMTRTRDQRTAEETMTFGEGAARASIAKRFKGLEAMRRAATQIKGPAEIEAAREHAKKLMEQYREEVVEFYKGLNYRGGIDVWNGLDASMRAVAKWAKTKSRSATDLKAALRSENFKPITDELAALGVEAGEAFLAAPVPYFEAKPLRAVALGEFAGAAIPSDASAEVRKVLTDAGIPFKEYGNRHDEAARAKAVIELARELTGRGARVLFQKDSRKTPPTGPRTADEINAEYQKLREEFQRLLEEQKAAVEETAALLKRGGRLYQNAPGPIWTSKLRDTLEAKMGGKMDADQLRKMLLSAGVKPEEMKWSGFDELTGTITKAEALSYFDANRVEIREVVKGGGEATSYDSLRWEDVAEIPSGFDSGLEAEFLDRRGEPGKIGLYMAGDGWWVYQDGEALAEDVSARQARDVVNDFLAANVRTQNDATPTKFSSYKLPGGENYREMLFTLPQDQSQREYERTATEITRDLNAGNFADEEEARSMRAERDRLLSLSNQASRAEYLSSHWDEPNVLAHARFQDFTDAEGRRVLLVEEIQSDWHQEGRKKGYRNQAADFTTIRAKQADIFRRFDAGEIDEAQRAVELDALAGERSAEFAKEKGVPAAPFAKTWPEMVFKRMLRYAAENGYDRIAWTPGEVQAERYDLSKQVKVLDWTGDKSGWKAVTITPTAGNDIEFRVKPDGVVTGFGYDDAGNGFGGKRLDEVIGKDLADKVLAERHGTLSGLDLKVGGEGMKGFYDVMLPGIASKLVKKWGGKVGETRIRTAEITELLSRQRLLPGGQLEDLPGGFSVTRNGFALGDVTADREEAERLASTAVPSVDITPEMQAAVLQGQPLFQAAYHGSPYKFDKFSLEHMGRGEGAQAYGWGLYFAGKKSVAEWYRHKLSSPSVTVKIGGEKFSSAGKTAWGDIRDGLAQAMRASSALSQSLRDELNSYTYGGGETGIPAPRRGEIAQDAFFAVVDSFLEGVTPEGLAEKARPKAEKELTGNGSDWGILRARAVAKIADAFKTSLKVEQEVSGRTYKVDLKPAEDEYLYWDKPLSEQSEKVKAVLAAIKKEISGIGQKGAVRGAMTGQRLYDQLSYYFDLNGKAEKWAAFAEKGAMGSMSTQGSMMASRYLASKGIPGIKYLDATSRDAGEGSYNYVIFDENLVSIEEYWAQGPSGPQGSITFPTPLDPRTVIDLFKSANPSTMLHEMGHLFFDNLNQAAAVSPDAAKDLGVLLDFLGADSWPTLTVEQQEKFARTWEKYLYTGKAPSTALQSVFAKVKAWLVTVYKSIFRIPGAPKDIPDAVRDVMDRLLATQEEIDAAKAPPAWETAAEGEMSASEFAAYQRAVKRSIEEQTAALQSKMLNAVRRGRASWWRKAKEEMRGKIVAALDAEPAYQAIAFFSRGEPPAGRMIPVGKLSRESLVSYGGEEILAQLPKAVPPIWSAAGQYDVDTAAELLGFPDSYAFLEALKTTKPRKAEIAARLEAAMAAEYGDPALDGTLPEAVLKATHAGDARGQVLMFEIQAALRKAVYGPSAAEQKKETISKATAERRETQAFWAGVTQGEDTQKRRDLLKAKAALNAMKVTPEEVGRLRENLRTQVRGIPLNTLKPQKYLVSERQAQRKYDVASAKNEWLKAAEAKRAVLVNHLLYSEAVTAQEEAEKIRKYLVRYESANAGPKALPLDYRERIEALLEEVGLKTSTAKSVQEQASRRQIALGLRAWILDLQARADGGEAVDIPEIDPVILNAPTLTHYTEMPLELLSALRDAVRSIEMTGRNEARLIAAGRAEDLRNKVQELVERAEQQPQRAKSRRITAKPTELEKGIAYLRRPGNFLRTEMDGGLGVGPWYSTFFEPVAVAEARKRDLITPIAEEIEAAAKEYLGPRGTDELASKEWTNPKAIPALGVEMSRNEILSLALNLGNEDNIDRLLQGFVVHEGGDVQEWTLPQIVKAVEENLTPDQLRFVGAVWQAIDKFWPALEQVHIKATGIRPQKVEAKTITLAGVELPGGYYPIAYNAHAGSNIAGDAGAGAKTERYDAAKAVKESTGQFMRAMTRTGHTEVRTGGGGQQVLLDLGVLWRHMDDVAHDIAYRLVIRDLNKLLAQKEIIRALTNVGGEAMLKELRGWVGDIATDYKAKHEATQIERLLLRARSGAVMVSMGYNVAISLDAFADLAQFTVPGSIGPRYLWEGARAALAGLRPESTVREDAVKKSAFLRDYQASFNRDVLDVQRRSLTGKKQSGFHAAAFAMVGQISYQVAVTGWLGAYAKGLDTAPVDLDAKGREAFAVQYADAETSRILGTGRIKDLARVLRPESQASRLYTTFYGWFSKNLNLFLDVAALYKRGHISKPQLFGVAMALWIFPTILPEILRGRYRRPDDEEEEQTWAAFAAKKALTDLLLFPVMHVPLAGSLLNAAIRSRGGRVNWEASPAFRPVTGAVQLIVDLGQTGGALWAGEDDPLSEIDFRSAVDTVGAWTGTPGVGQARKTVEAFRNWLASDETRPGDVINTFLGVPPGTERK